MKVYTCRKRVEAAKILAIRDISATHVELQCGPTEVYTVDTDWVRKLKRDANDLGYIVRYEDGYTSWSPTKAFEEGYTETDFGDALAGAVAWVREKQEELDKLHAKETVDGTAG